MLIKGSILNSNNIETNNVKLSNGLLMPCICYGSPIIYLNTENKSKLIKSCIGKIIKNKSKEIVKVNNLNKIIKKAKNISEKISIDTSRAYGGSEFFIGKAIKNNRDKYFIVTKISNAAQYSGKIEEEVKTSLKMLNVEYIDCLLMHWPVEGIYINTWKEMERIYIHGMCKSIGVCNCNIHHLEKIKEVSEIKPMINQFECHPLFTQNELREYCKNENIKIMAYTATARMDNRLENTCLTEIAKKHEKTVAQIILRWHIQIGNIPIFNTMSWKHYISNMDIFDFNLNEEELNKISAININSRLRYDPDNCDFKKL